MVFQGVSVPRIGEKVKLLSPNQQIDGVFEVIDVRWQITNKHQGTARYKSEAQAEIWVRPLAPRLESTPTNYLLVMVLGLLGIAVMTAITLWAVYGEWP